MRSIRHKTLAAIVLALLMPVAALAQGKTLRLASAFDPQSMDPHSLALLYQTRVASQIYEGLVNRGKDYKLEPSLATAWEMVNPTTWRFRLRQGVKFHDGASFTADDAVFSIERALDKASQRKNQMLGITGARKVDASTIEVSTSQPDAVLPDKRMFAPSPALRALLEPFDETARGLHLTNMDGHGPMAL